MPSNAFIRFLKSAPSTIFMPGESYQETHPGTQGWVEISDWGWEVEAETSFLKGGGSAVGKPQPGNMTFSHYYDLSSPQLMMNIVRGTTFPIVTVDFLKQTGTGTPQVFLRVQGSEVFITKVSTKGGEDGAVTQDIEMVFKEIAIGYKVQDNNGSLEKIVNQFAWNVAHMNEEVNPVILPGSMT